MAVYKTRFTCPTCGLVDVTDTCAVISDPPDAGTYITDIPNEDYPVKNCEGWYYGKGQTGHKARECEARAAWRALPESRREEIRAAAEGAREVTG